MRRLCVAMISLCFVWAVALIQPPAQGADAPPETPRAGEPYRRPHRPHRPSGDSAEAPTEAQWKEAEAFLQQYSPRRFEAYGKMSDGKYKSWVRRIMYNRYAGMQKLQKKDPDLYALRLEHLQLEDAVFGLAGDLRRENRPKKKDQVRRQLEDKVSEMVKVDFRERQHRIDLLEKKLEQERSRLAKDQADEPALVQKRIDNILREMDAHRRSESDRKSEPPGSKEEPPQKNAVGSASAPNPAQESQEQ